MSDGLARFLDARQFLLTNREDHESACAGFRWPELHEFNWALEWVDHLGAAPASAQLPALHIGGFSELRA